MAFLGQLLVTALDIYVWIIIASVITSWLIAFEVIKVSNPQAANIVRLLGKLTDPVYKPIRKYIPPIGGLDLTPIVVIFGVYVLQYLIMRIFIYPF
ncbi:MAG: YggT family protein [Rhodospirillales bacterium]|nr:YggT family protein [Rhodospirillales bacterium]